MCPIASLNVDVAKWALPFWGRRLHHYVELASIFDPIEPVPDA
jgi:hypothetical protein